MVDMKKLPVYLHIFIGLCHYIGMEQQFRASVRFNHNLASGYCLKNHTKTSYSECLAHFEKGNTSFNAMVYRRSFLLCSLCYVPTSLSVRKEPGFMMAHTHITDTSTENLALNKPTNQSATFFTSAYGNASSTLAVDGNRQTAMVQGNRYVCAQIDSDSSGEYWWIVDLGHIYSVSKVVIYNRNDCCGHWLKELDIKVGESLSEKSMHLCEHYKGPPATGYIVTIICQQPLLGKFVQIKKTINEGMVLCEVEVYH
ncbi:fucolectin-like [Ruditapes philippinarum]|uniref:fucolectin-like n=1 Tax=Ruditapes philippinarum TaxID=129788 RepID=UPI00295A698B|nr:fucolectin-like [Ruditapes philippinarum]